jgi:hypothetical protein
VLPATVEAIGTSHDCGGRRGSNCRPRPWRTANKSDETPTAIGSGRGSDPLGVDCLVGAAPEQVVGSKQRQQREQAVGEREMAEWVHP